MNIVTIILLIAGLLAAARTGVVLYRVSQVNAIRRRPPRRVCFQVKLPPDADKSNVKMTHAWERIWSIIPSNPRFMRKNGNVIRMALVGEGAQEGAAPTVRFMVWCPPSLAEKVQLELTECYQGDAEIMEIPPERDPFSSYLRLTEAHRRYERDVAEWEAGASQPDPAAHESAADSEPEMPLTRPRRERGLF